MSDERRFVVDTNCLVSRLVMPRGVAAQAVDRALAQGTLLMSAATLDELSEVLSRRKFDRYVSVADRQRFLTLLGSLVRLVPVVQGRAICGDPEDEKFLHLALAGEAYAVVTGDRDLQILHPFHGVAIVSPADFLRALPSTRAPRPQRR
jgi:putative PIN family toxin of toxin-antitoxin system